MEKIGVDELEQVDVVLLLKNQAPCIKRLDNLYSVIDELFCNYLITLLCAKEVLFEQTALNKYCTQKYLFNCFIVYLPCFPL